MAIAFAIFLFILGMALLVVAAVLTSIHKATHSFLNGFPQMMRQMMIDSDPKMQSALKKLELFPKIGIAVAVVGVLVLLAGIFKIPSHIAQGILLVLAASTGFAFWKYRDKLVELLKKQFTDQMQKQAASRPRPTPAQAKTQFRNMQQTMRDQAAARPPTNRSERRQAQRKKQ